MHEDRRTLGQWRYFGDLVLAMMVSGRKDGGSGPTSVAGIGRVGSTHPSSPSSRSAESDDEIMRENPTTAVVLCEIRPVVGAAVAISVVGLPYRLLCCHRSGFSLMRRARIDRR